VQAVKDAERPRIWLNASSGMAEFFFVASGGNSQPSKPGLGARGFTVVRKLRTVKPKPKQQQQQRLKLYDKAADPPVDDQSADPDPPGKNKGQLAAAATAQQMIANNYNNTNAWNKYAKPGDGLMIPRFSNYWQVRSSNDLARSSNALARSSTALARSSNALADGLMIPRFSNYWKNANLMECFLNYAEAAADGAELSGAELYGLVAAPNASFVAAVVRQFFAVYTAEYLVGTKPENTSYDDMQWMSLTYLRAHELCLKPYISIPVMNS